VRVETDTPGGRSVQVYDGSRGWVSSPNGTMDLPRQALAVVESALERDTIALLLAAERGEVRVRLLPDVKDEAGRLHHALEFSSPQLEPVVFQIDPETSRLAKLTYVVPGPGQPLVEELFSDYKEVNGVQVAHAAQLRQSGKTLLERQVTSVEINTDVPAQLFRRPTS
jgi:hypothetical protein